MGKIKEVKIGPGCISCGTCEVVCPKVFEINEISQLRPDVDFQEYEACINEAAQMCPVNVIEVVCE